MSENKRKKSGDPMAKAMELTIWQSAKTDPQGSYTGQQPPLQILMVLSVLAA